MTPRSADGDPVCVYSFARAHVDQRRPPPHFQLNQPREDEPMFRIPATDLPAPPERIDPTELIPLAELAAEGFGYGSPFVTTLRDAVDALAAELGDQATLDDIGRRCVTRETARRLFDERHEAERRRQEVQERNEAQLAKRAANNVPRPRIPADEIPEGVNPVTWLLQTAKDAEPRRQSVLEHALANRDGSLTYHPIREEES
jgi:hypothetical protein